MVRITGNFQQERVLHPASASLLSELFLKGWPDPSKLNNQSRQTALLLQQAKESFAKHLSVRADEIEFLGEVDLGFQLGIQGLLSKESRLAYSAIDRQKVFAVAAAEEKAGRSLNLLPVNDQGDIQESLVSENDLLVWQVANGETGNLQRSPTSKAQIFADCTSSGIDHLPKFEYQSALFDSTSWAGPAGVGVLVIKSSAKWRNPLPHNDLVRVPNSFSLPLVLASAVAMENYATQSDIRLKLKGEFNSEIQPILDNEKAISLGLDPVEDEALKITRKTREQLEKAPSLKSVWSKFTNFVDQYNWKGEPFFNPIPVGFNIIGFDMIIINRLCKEFGPWDKDREQQKLFSKVYKIDIMDNVFAWTESDPTVKSISMDSLRDRMGLSTENAHDALQDVKDSANIFIKLMKTHRAVYQNMNFDKAFANGNLYVK